MYDFFYILLNLVQWLQTCITAMLIEYKSFLWIHVSPRAAELIFEVDAALIVLLKKGLYGKKIFN